MMTTVKQAEKFAAKTLTEDGLIDFFSGIGLIAIGYFWLIDNSALSAIMPLAIVNFWKISRKRISEPRIGKVTLARGKKGNVRAGRTILIIVSLTLAVGVILWLKGGAGDVQGTWYYPLFAAGPSLFIATITFFSAIYLKCPRFFGYAGWIIAAAGITIWLGEGPARALMISGVPFLVVGLWTFAKFLSAHPKADQ
ncbi:MAG: hypothetical protein IH901_05560 [Proteobacteria bacterium]|nr:hypothetical protein [Pseudomonadota bacterium]